VVLQIIGGLIDIKKIIMRVTYLQTIHDNKLSMGEHILQLCRTSFYQLRQLRVIRQSLTYETCVILVHAFVNSRLDYCNSLLFGASTHLIGRLQSVMRAAARLIFQKRKFDRIRLVMISKTSFIGFPFSSELSTSSLSVCSQVLAR